MSVEGGGDVDVEFDGSVVALDVLFNLGDPDVGQVAGVEFGMASEAGEILIDPTVATGVLRIDHALTAATTRKGAL